MSSFLVVDTLVIDTQSSGQCCIELCQGDITQLDIKDKVDVICVSVFGSEYEKSTVFYPRESEMSKLSSRCPAQGSCHMEICHYIIGQ